MLALQCSAHIYNIYHITFASNHSKYYIPSIILQYYIIQCVCICMYMYIISFRLSINLIFLIVHTVNSISHLYDN
jgi:hypothetical protein